MYPASTIACSTTLRRSRHRAGLLNGDSARRRLQHAGHRRGFGERDVADVLAEEEARRLGDADDGERAALSERHVVQIHLEDLVLRGARFEHERQELFERLAPDAALARALQRPALELRQEDVAHELLRDRAGRRDAIAAAEQVVDDRAGQPDRIDARVVVVAPILDREHGLDHAGRDRRQGDGPPLFALAADERRQQRRVERQALAGLRRRARARARDRPARGGGRAPRFGRRAAVETRRGRAVRRAPRDRGWMVTDAVADGELARLLGLARCA